jgi:putative tricarboxylic transport membrane protein
MVKRIGSEAIGSLFWIGVGLFFAVEGISLNVGILKNPGPGFLPVMMATLLVLFSLFILIKGLMKPQVAFPKIFWKKQFLAVVSVFFYIFLLEFIDFLLSTFILMFILFAILIKERKRWSKILCYSAAVALAAWLVFYVVIRTPFPFPRFISIWS